MKGLADFGLPFLIDLPMAQYGVTLFFVISGFLITFLLIKEMDETSSINVKKFYVRRILRIWPIYYLFILFCIVFLYLNGNSNEITSNKIYLYLFFAANVPHVFENGIMILAHYWSIGVEEQFYLFWPWLVKFSRKNIFSISALIFLTLFLSKIAFWWFLGNKSYEYRAISITRFHCMMIGSMGAILYFNNHVNFKRLFSNKGIQIISWILFLTMGLNIIRLPYVISNEVIAFTSLSMIMGQITVTKRIINLEYKPMDFIGKISYGIYVIHPLIIILFSKLYINLNMDLTLKYIMVYSTVIATTIFIAWLSFRFFETPFLKLKNRYTIVMNANSRPVKN